MPGYRHHRQRGRVQRQRYARTRGLRPTAPSNISQIGASAQYQNFGAFHKNGTSTWTLTGTTAEITPWTINAGTLAAVWRGGYSVGDASGGLSFNGGTLRFDTAFTTGRTITLNAGGGTIDVEAGPFAGLSGDIGGNGSIAKTGAGILVLSGNNSYGGPTAVNAGTLVAASNSALPGDTAVKVNLGAELALADGVQLQIGSLADGPSGGGGVLIGAVDNSTTLFIAGSASTTFSGSFAGVGSLEIDNGAALTLTGASNGGNIGTIGGDLELCSCDTGGLTISGGSLTVNSLSMGVAVFGGTLAVINGGTLQVGPGGQPDLLVAGNMIVSGAGSAVKVAGLHRKSGFLDRRSPRSAMAACSTGPAKRAARRLAPLELALRK